MNKQQVKGAAKEVTGKMQQAYGNAKSGIKSGMKRAAQRNPGSARDRDIERHAH